MSADITEFPPDPRGSAPAGGDSGGSASLVELVAEAAADAAREAIERHGPDTGRAGSYAAARGLWVAMNMLLGPESARSFVVFLAGRFLEDFELKRKGVN